MTRTNITDYFTDFEKYQAAHPTGSHTTFHEFYHFAFKGEDEPTELAFQEFKKDIKEAYILDSGFLFNCTRKYQIFKAENWKRKKSHKKSNLLNDYCWQIVSADIPAGLRRGGRISTQGVFQGIDKKTGKVKLTPNRSQKGKLDVCFEFIFGIPDFNCETKTTDSLRPAQKEFIQFQTARGHYCCVCKSEAAILQHWNSFKKLYDVDSKVAAIVKEYNASGRVDGIGEWWGRR